MALDSSRRLLVSLLGLARNQLKHSFGQLSDGDGEKRAIFYVDLRYVATVYTLSGISHRVGELAIEAFGVLYFHRTRAG